MEEENERAEGSASVADDELKAIGSAKDSLSRNPRTSSQLIYVDVVIPVHNAEETVEDAVRSAMHQVVPPHLDLKQSDIDLAVCCYDDGSQDESWSILCRLEEEYKMGPRSNEPLSTPKERDELFQTITTKLLVGSGKDGVSRGAGDDTMHCTRVAEQVYAMLSIPNEQKHRTIFGCNFDRDPPDSTWHYSQWANSLTDERLMLERYREVTVLQPTWFMSKSRFTELGGYIEAPHPISKGSNSVECSSMLPKCESFQLIHPSYDTPQSLRLAEDLRLFHTHLHANGLLRLHRTPTALVTYRHRAGMSQSSQTPRKLLLQLRVLAFERNVLRSDPLWLKHGGSFVVWGAGRDGKDFVKALSDDLRHRVACFVDVDHKKISAGYYVNKELDVKIPILHFSMLVSDPETREQMLKAWEEESQGNNAPQFGQIDKSRNPRRTTLRSAQKDPTRQDMKKQFTRPCKKIKLLDSKKLDVAGLPVVVCVAMYRTNGALEKNVRSIGRTEGRDLWHFS